MDNSVVQQNNMSKGWVLLSAIMFTWLGFYIYNQPASALVTLVFYIAIVKIISGCTGIFAYFKNKEEKSKWTLAIVVLDLLFGLFLLFSPMLKLTLIAFMPYFLGSWALVRGVFMCIGSFNGKREIKNWVLNFILGIISIIAAFVIFANPIQSSIVALNFMGIFFIIMGFSMFFQFIFMLFSKQK